jgi:hypothetical protein
MAKRKQDKSTNNDLQNITHKTKDRVTHIPLTTRGEQVLRKGRLFLLYLCLFLHLFYEVIIKCLLIDDYIFVDEIHHYYVIHCLSVM